MTRYTLVLSPGDIVWPGLVQGLGLGLVFVPLSAATFSTLPPARFAQGTATYSLVRNIGSSIGISLVQTLLERNTQIAHASIAATITPDRLAASAYGLQAAGLAALEGEVTRQATMIAYVDDYTLILWLTVAMIPLLLFIRPSRRGMTDGAAHAAVD